MTGPDSVLWSPRRSWWWLAVLFGAGSVCFLVAPLPPFLQLVGPQADAAVFLAGSVPFTAAATVQFLGTDRARTADWWSAAVQLAGTVAFNVTTLLALRVAIGSPSYDRLVWRPDAIGSTCFLVSGLIAYAAVAGGPLRRPPRSLDGAVVAVDLFGCVAFGVAALASYVLPGGDDELAGTVAGAATSVGGAAFLAGAVLLLPQGARLSRAPDATAGRRG